jgi:hypothetical protein
MGRAGKVGVHGVDNGQVVWVEPELAVLRRGSGLLSSSGCRAQ